MNYRRTAGYWEGQKVECVLGPHIPEAILADNFSICSFQDRVSSISTPSYFAHETCFKHHILINRDHSGAVSRVLNLCLEPININSVLDVLRVSLLAMSNWLWIEICENLVLSKIDITMTEINKKL